jgi:predicted acetyltransferase
MLCELGANKDLTRLHALALAKPGEYLTAVRSMAPTESNVFRSAAVSTFWLVDRCSEVVGEVYFRHELTASLKLEGGHIGYVVRPSARSKGCATEGLRLILGFARQSGLREAILTCDDDNIASVAAIVSNGGRLTARHRSLYSNRVVRQFAIDLAAVDSSTARKRGTEG